MKPGRIRFFIFLKLFVGAGAVGGKDRRTLFITASTSLYSIRMRLKGANPAK
jgi:sugar lactone lactonase YvrE